jgi:hypothetical protein
LRGFTKSKKKHMLKISAVYLIGNPEICQDPPTWSQDDQTLCQKNLSKTSSKKICQNIRLKNSKIYQKIRHKSLSKNSSKKFASGRKLKNLRVGYTIQSDSIKKTKKLP